MERQQMMILFLALSLLLASKVRILAAEESTANSQTVRYKLAKMARTFLGLPYRWGGNVGTAGRGLFRFGQNDFRQTARRAAADFARTNSVR